MTMGCKQMKLATEKQGLLTRLSKDRQGNFAFITALLLPVLLGAGGITIDVTKMIMNKSRLQDASDSAALAAASALANDGYSIEDAKLLALQLLKQQMAEGNSIDEDESGNDTDDPNSFDDTVIDIQQLATVGTGKRWDISVSASYTMSLNPLTKLLVKDKATLTAKTAAESATESKNALSMFLVVDRSGSMSFKTDEILSTTTACKNWTDSNWGSDIKATKPCYVRKIGALKLAVASLMTELNKATADSPVKLVRTAAVSYNDKMQTETSLAWGTTGALAYVNALPDEPTGGTDSHGAFQKAYDKLVPSNSTDETENPAHKQENGQVPTKYIVFMTDGNNTAYNGSSSTSNGKKADTDTKTYCDKARASKLQVYTVAFMAPTNGQNLLKYCATTEENYYEAEDMDQLVQAFKAIGEKATAQIARLTH